MTKVNIKHILTTLLAITICSCTTDIVFHKYQPISLDGWEKGDTLFFILPDSIGHGSYKAEIGIRHTTSYPYKDLWLSVEQPSRNKADTIHVYMANDRGNWNGKGTTGGYFQISVPYNNFKYTSTSDSILKVFHIMEDNPLQSVTDLGIKIWREK